MKKFKDLKICFAGPGGGGKTTLLKKFIEEDFTKLQVQTASLMPEGISTHEDVIKMAVNNPQAGIDFQGALIETRTKAFKDADGGFVSDRSVIDSLMYYALQNSAFDTNENSNRLYDLAIKSLSYYDLTVVLSPRLADIASEEGHRVTNSLSYETQSCILSSLLMASVPVDASAIEVQDESGKVWGSMFRTGDHVILVLDEPNGFLPTDVRYSIIKSAYESLASASTPTAANLH